MISTYYDMNETMQLIGCQPVQPILDNKEFKKDFENMVNAHSIAGKGYYNTILDALLLGIIYGKRLERAKKRK